MLIHVEPLLMMEASKRMNVSAFDGFEAAFALRVCAHRLDMSWQSPRADDFQAELATVVTGLERNLSALEEMAWVLRREAETWLESDHLWSQQFRAPEGREVEG